MGRTLITPEMLEADKDPREPLYADHLYAQHRAIAGSLQGENFFDRYDRTFEQGAPASIEEDKQQHIMEELEALHEAFGNSLTGDPEVAVENSEVLGDVEQEIIEEAHNPLFVVRHIAQALAEDNDLPEEVLDYVAEQMYYGYILGDIFEQGWGATARDFAGMLWTNMSFIGARVVEGEGGAFRSARDLERLGRQFRNLPIEDRLEVFYDLVDDVMAETGNSLKAMSIINGIISDEGHERIAMDQLLDKIGTAGWLVDFLTVGTFAGRRLAHPVRVMAMMRQEKRALDLVVDAFKNEQARKVMNMDQVDAAAHLSPTNMADELFTGMPSVVKGELARRMAKTQEAFSSMPSQVLTEGIESMVDPALALSRAESTIMSNEAGLAVTNIQVMEYGPRGMTLRYQVMGPDSPSVTPNIGPNAPKWQQDALRLAEQTDTSWREIARQVGKPKSTVSDFLRKNYYPRQQHQGPPAPAQQTKTFEFYYSVDDTPAAGFSQDVHQWRIPIIQHLASPAYKFQDEIESLVRVMQRGMFQSGKWRNMFQKQYSEIWHMAPREQRMHVGKALEQGNLDGVVYNYQDLRGMGLSDAGVQQYYAFRELMDQAWLLKNREIANMHIVSGHQLFSLGDKTTPVKPYASHQAAEGSIRQSGAKTALVFDDTAVEGRSMGLFSPDGTLNPQLRKYYDDGYVLMRPQTEMGIYEHMGKGYKFVLARRSETRAIDPSDKFLNYHQGYLPIFYGPVGKANYFGQTARYGTVDGATTKIGEGTKVYFSNRTDADAWARQNNINHLMTKEKMTHEQAAAALTDPTRKDQLPFSIKTDREIRQHEFDTWYAGGPYTGHRGQERLRRGIQEDSAQFIDPFDSMQKYLDHLANHMPLSAYRIGLEDKWMKHARHHGALRKGFAGNFAEARAVVEGLDARSLGKGGAEIRQFLLSSHDHISFNNRVASLGERSARGWTIATAERLENILGKESRAVSFLHRMDQVHMPDMVRAVTFHSLLGLFAPAQYVVQASGALVGMSIDPVNFTKGMPYAMAIKTLDNTPIAMRPQMLERIESYLPGTKVRYEAWQKTGLHDAVVSTSADYRSVVSSYPTGQDMYRRIVGETALATDKMAFFYKAGELINRRYSFATAMERHLAKGGKLDEAGIKLALNDANTFMLNMDRANKAAFQKGWWGVPTQFMQVHTKYMENLLGKQLTHPERARLMGVQLAMFGSMGVPFGSGILAYGLKSAGVEPGGIGPNTASLAHSGMINWLLAEVMGFNNEVASRISIPNGVGETFRNVFIDNAGLWETLAGAGGSLPQRSLEFGLAMRGIFHANDRDLTEMDSTDVILAGQEFLKMASSGRSAVAAYHMFKNDEVWTNRGILLDSNDFTTREIIARGLGFQLSEVAEMRQNFRTKKFLDQYVNERVDMAMNYITGRFNVAGGATEKDWRALDNMIRIMSATSPPGTEQRIRDGVANRLEVGNTQVDQAAREIRQRYLDETWHHLDILSRHHQLGD
jgi:hypothetical protein